MTMTIPVATARIGREVRTAEADILRALASSAALLHSFAQAREDITEGPAIAGHETMLRISRTCGELLTARGSILRAHASMRNDLKVVGGPDNPYCPDYTGADDSEAVTMAA